MTTVDGSRGVPQEPGFKPTIVTKPVELPVPPPSPPAPPGDDVILGPTARQVQAAGEGIDKVEADIPPSFDKAPADKAVSGIKMLLGYGRSDWEVNAPETLEALNSLMALPDEGVRHALQRLRQEDGGLYDKRLRENLREEGLNGILAQRERVAGTPPGAARQEASRALAAAVAGAHLRAMCIADYDTLDRTAGWLKSLAEALPSGIRQAVESPNRPPGAIRKQLREKLERPADAAGLQQALVTAFRISGADAAQFAAALKVQAK